MSQQIQFRRGLEASRSGIIPEQGEPIYTTDTKKLYLGDGITRGGNQYTNGYIVTGNVFLGANGTGLLCIVTGMPLISTSVNITVKAILENDGYINQTATFNYDDTSSETKFGTTTIVNHSNFNMGIELTGSFPAQPAIFLGRDIYANSTRNVVAKIETMHITEGLESYSVDKF